MKPKINKKIFTTFYNRSPTPNPAYSYSRPDKQPLGYSSSQSVLVPILNRMSIDVSQVGIRHVYTDDNGDYTGVVDSSLNRCLELSANLDQTGRNFIKDAAFSMYEEGCIAIVPTDTSFNVYSSENTGDIYELRVGKITTWHPGDVDVELYNEDTGLYELITVPKEKTAIIENPMYEIMNSRNSTMQRLLRAMTSVDVIETESGSGKMNILIQLPYVTRRDAKAQEAKKRMEDLESQMANNRYGIGYIDSTEHVIQLNRPADNSAYERADTLTKMLYGQLGITQSILDGTADEQTLINYERRVIIPTLDAFVDEFKRKFLPFYGTKNKSIAYMRDPFKLVPVSQLADVADKMSRNEIMSSNEIRVKIGLSPSDQPGADELRNKNITQTTEADASNSKKGQNQNGS